MDKALPNSRWIADPRPDDARLFTTMVQSRQSPALPSFGIWKYDTMREWLECESCAAAPKGLANGPSGLSSSIWDADARAALLHRQSLAERPYCLMLLVE